MSEGRDLGKLFFMSMSASLFKWRESDKLISRWNQKSLRLAPEQPFDLVIGQTSMRLRTDHNFLAKSQVQVQVGKDFEVIFF